MTADEARDISERAKAAIVCRPYMEHISRAAESGSFSTDFGSLEKEVADAFETLGYEVTLRAGGGNLKVSWSKPKGGAA